MPQDSGTSPEFTAGFAQVDITPTRPCYLAGSLDPRNRVSEGVADPLFVRAAVFESGGTRLAYAVFDLCVLKGRDAGPAVSLASRVTGIPEDHIVWTCTHTHNGPCSIDKSLYPDAPDDLTDPEWLEATLDAFVTCVREADAAREPVRVCRGRGFACQVVHNRRVIFKNGLHINTWNLGGLVDHPQSLGSAGPVDPEVGMLAFETLDGELKGVLYNFALHANRQGGKLIGADYPGWVARRLSEEHGKQVVSLYAPGACGDVNPTRAVPETGEILVDVICRELARRRPLSRQGGQRGGRCGAVPRDRQRAAALARWRRRPGSRPAAIVPGGGRPR